MSITSLNKLRLFLDKHLPFLLVEWLRINYISWFISRTLYIWLFTRPFEHITSFGEKNPNITYYIITRDSWLGNGLFTCVLCAVSAIEYARERNYIPVIDMKNGLNPYLEANEIGVVNAWDYYFEQPLENINKKYSLEEAYISNRVIVENANYGGIVQALYPVTTPSLLRKNTKVLQRWSIQYKKYIRLNETTKKHVEDQYKKIIREEDRVIGICVRGGEHRFLHPCGHPIQPEISSIINDARSFMEKWNCNKIFLTTEDEDILHEFKQVFGEIVVSTERQYVKYILCHGDEGQYLRHIKPPKRESEKYLNGLEYLTDIVILSRCNCIIGSTTSGTIASVLMADGFEHTHFYDCGVFGLTDKDKCGDILSNGMWILK